MDSNPCVATGKNALSGQWQQTKIGYGGRGQRFSISAPRDDADSLTSRYHVWEVEKWVANRDAGDVVHLRIDPVSLAVSDADAVSPDKFSDVRAVPALNNPNKDACFVYVAHDGGDSAYLRLFELDAHNKWTVVNWQPPTKSGGGQCSGRDPSAGNASRRSRWMTYDGPNDVLGDQSSEGNENLWWVDGRKKGRPPLKGIISLSPCKDGTILASIYNRWLFTATDTLRLYTSGYSIDL